MSGQLPVSRNPPPPAILSVNDLIGNVRTPSAKDLPDDSPYFLKRTPYERSFASRIHGFSGMPGSRTTARSISKKTDDDKILHFRDWNVKPPWVGILEDINAHYILKNDLEEGLHSYQTAPIDYVGLQELHLHQVHSLLEIAFWPGIDVSAAMENAPEKYTVVAMYKRVVVGAALISPPPDEAYVTYITVRAGWEFSGIGMTMLYLLISKSPDRDIILHVSTDNPAMLLYNKYGFKAEEFVAGFYEDYLDPESKTCRNALRLRLRQT